MELVGRSVWVLCINVMLARSLLHIKYTCPPYIIKTLAGVKDCLQMFLTLEPDKDECLAAFLLWKAPSVPSGPQICSGEETL